ncbi:MAG: hypothetical protein ACOY93_22115 [Bacillota bacterium]
MMGQTVTFHRSAVLELARGPWATLWLVTPALQAEALRPLLPHLDRAGAQVRVLTDLSLEALVDGRVELAALQRLKALPSCEVRGLPELAACLYAAEGGPALVSAAPLTVAGLDGLRTYGVLLPDSAPVLEDLNRWWAAAEQLSPVEWSALADRVGQRRDAHRIGAEIARLGAFVRVSTRGTRRSRKLDPRDFGMAVVGAGPRVRPLDLMFYKLDVVTRAKEELDSILAENGLEWNGQYLVPRRFLEQEWPRLFAEKERQLNERLKSPENRGLLKEQLQEARRQLESFFGELYPWIDADGLAPELWVEVQTTKVLSEAVVETVLEESGLEYRVLTILPEDRRSMEELDLLLQDPKLRSVQLTFPL